MQKVSIIFILSCLITGCATITQDNNTSVMVQSVPEGAKCYVLESSADKVTTPGVISLPRRCKDVTIVCNKQGYEQTTKVIPSELDGSMAGNVIFSGPIGAGIDGWSGKGCVYSKHVVVVMNEKNDEK